MPFQDYARVYDLLYKDKDYHAESVFVVELIRRFLPAASRAERIIDLACGTGRHVIELAGMGYKVTGRDVSEEMVAIAKAAAARQQLDIPLHVGSLQSCVRVGGKFDVALALFSSLGYLSSQKDLEVTLSGVRRLLAPGGLFVFDVWNGLAVMRDYSPLRVKRASDNSTSVLRISNTTIDEIGQIAKVEFQFLVFTQNRPPIEFSEAHNVRFFFPRELTDTLVSSGFEVLLRCPFMNSTKPLEQQDWNMTFVVRKQASGNVEMCPDVE